MAIEQGIVIKMGSRGADTAWVKMVRSSACKSCSSRHSCHEADSGQTQEVEALNPVDAKIGDRIQLSIAGGSLLKAMSLLYLFPVLCMLAGGLAGQWLGPKLNISESALSVLSALVCLGLSLIIVRSAGQRMASKAAYRPRILRVIGHESMKPETPPCTIAAPYGIEPHPAKIAPHTQGR